MQKIQFAGRYTNVMLLPQTLVVLPEWMRAQNLRLWLTPGEREVYAAWASEKRKSEWLAGRLAAKRLLWEEFGISPLDWQVGRDGAAPAIIGLEVPNIALSLSHSGGSGAATVSNTCTEGTAGVDIQRVRPVHPGLRARVFTDNERRQIASQFGSEDSADGMLLFWALKEAAIKARRQAWGRSLQEIEVHFGEPGFSKVVIKDEAAFRGQFVRVGAWWLARAVKPSAR